MIGSHEAAPPRRDRKPLSIRHWILLVACAGVLLVGATLVAGVFLGGGLVLAYVAALPSREPGRVRLDGADAIAVRDAARALMKDAKARGLYWDGHRLFDMGDTPPDPKTTRRLSELPGFLARMKPDLVAIGAEEVDLEWDGRQEGYGYGYSLVLLADGTGATARQLRHNDGDFRCNVELADGVWSCFKHH